MLLLLWICFKYGLAVSICVYVSIIWLAVIRHDDIPSALTFIRKRFDVLFDIDEEDNTSTQTPIDVQDFAGPRSDPSNLPEAQKARMTKLENSVKPTMSQRAHMANLETNMTAKAFRPARANAVEPDVIPTVSQRARRMNLEADVTPAASQRARMMNLEPDVTRAASQRARMMNLEADVTPTASQRPRMMNREADAQTIADLQALATSIPSQRSAPDTGMGLGL